MVKGPWLFLQPWLYIRAGSATLLEMSLLCSCHAWPGLLGRMGAVGLLGIRSGPVLESARRPSVWRFLAFLSCRNGEGKRLLVFSSFETSSQRQFNSGPSN